MRGAPGDHGGSHGEPRIIPADAGSTATGALCDLNIEDHPRGCGEHLGSMVPILVSMGSSPRMRGAREPICFQSLLPGIIPADAGSTRGIGKTYSWSQDHPRGCGEHMYPNVRSCRNSGSSPRMRGARDVSVCIQ